MKCYIIGVMRIVKKILKKFGIGGIMNKFGKTLLTSLLVSSLAVSSVFAAPSVDDLKQNKEAAEKKVETLQDEMTSQYVRGRTRSDRKGDHKSNR